MPPLISPPFFSERTVGVAISSICSESILKPCCLYAWGGGQVFCHITEIGNKFFLITPPLFGLLGRAETRPGRVLLVLGITPPLYLDPRSPTSAPPAHQKSIRFFTISHMADSPCPNPYKTCRLLMLLEPFQRCGLKKHQKSIRFFTKI